MRLLSLTAYTVTLLAKKNLVFAIKSKQLHMNSGWQYFNVSTNSVPEDQIVAVMHCCCNWLWKTLFGGFSNLRCKMFCWGVFTHKHLPCRSCNFIYSFTQPFMFMLCYRHLWCYEPCAFVFVETHVSKAEHWPFQATSLATFAAIRSQIYRQSLVKTTP